MTRETKVGLLVGMGVILLIGIIISDHLSVAQHQDPAALTDFAGRAQDSINPLINPEADAAQASGFAHEQPSIRESILQQMPQTTGAMPSNAGPQAPWRPVPPGENTATGPLPELPRAYGVAQSPTEGLPPQVQATQPGQPMLQQPQSAPATLTLSHVPSGDPFPVRDAAPIQPDPGQRLAAGPQVPANPAASLFAPTTDSVQTYGAGPQTSALQITEQAPAPSSTEIIHYVAEGETLYQIAKKYYGNGDYWKIIAEHNKGKVRENGQVNENVRLVIPNRAGLAALGPDFIPVAREGARPVAARPGTPATAPKGYKVQAGDTLTKIAADQLGDGNRWEEIFELNKKKLKSPESLRVGMELIIPGKAGSAAGTVQPIAPRMPVAEPVGRQVPMPTAPPRDAARAGAKGKDYTVQSGDNLAYIAEVTLGSRDRWREVFDANRDRLDTPDDLRVGMKLRVPQ